MPVAEARGRLVAGIVKMIERARVDDAIDELNFYSTADRELLAREWESVQAQCLRWLGMSGRGKIKQRRSKK